MNAHADLGYVVARPKGKPDPADWVIIMGVAEFFELLDQAGWGPNA